MVTTPFALTRSTEAQAQALLDKGEWNLALGALAASADELMKRDDLIGHALFLPSYDQLLEDIGEAVGRRHLHEDVWPDAQGCTLIIASETYDTGGHSRVIEDVARHVPRPAIVLTDLFNRLHGLAGSIECLYRKAGDAAITLLPRGSLLDKVINLQRLVALLRPRHILLFGHHQDVVPYAAMASSRIRVPCSFVHHTDHHPALGGTIATFRHVDFTDHVRRHCTQALLRPAAMLPLHVPDQGAKAHVAHGVPQASMVTSGNPHKFVRTGPLAYQDLVRVACQTLGGEYHHIGALPEDWVQDIRLTLRRHGLDPDRFVHHGPVPSLWVALREINADVYLTSAPTGGGRASIEAHGCACPMVCFRHERAADRPLFVTDLHHDQAPEWSTLAELPAALLTVAQDSARHSALARAYYERHFSEAAFVAALDDVLLG